MTYYSCFDQKGNIIARCQTKEDKEFVFKGFGSNGQEILKEENKKYSDETFLKRKLLINKLFELLEN